MKKAKRIIIVISVLILAVLTGGLIYARYIVKRNLPDYNLDVSLKGLKDKVTVYRDKNAIPHIYAKNENDLARAIGYVMAQERLWQMDLLRRVTQGRLSEALGAELVEVDELMRSLRIPEKSKKVMASTESEIMDRLYAFANGVNQYIEDNINSLPFEFTVLGYKPEKWKPQHTVNLIGYMAWDLTMPWKIEATYNKIMKKVDKKLFKEIIPNYDDKKTPIFPGYSKEEIFKDLDSALVRKSSVLEDLGLVLSRGSNNWAVSGKKSITGKPLLANDMHLGYMVPGIWYRMHISVEGVIDSTGVALPGAGYIIAGHNRDIAWGMTNVMVDDMDFFVEKINPENRDEYLYMGKWKKMDIRREKIKIKGGQVLEREIRYTVHGPIISKFKKIKDRAISMHWVGNYMSNELKGVYLLNKAKNWKDFKNAVSNFRSISQNIVYADVKGNIGLYCCAGIPVRKKGSGLSFSPGWTDEYEWKGLVPFERQPHVYNPKSGMVSSANNKTVNKKYPHHISHWFCVEHRINRIRQILKSKDKFTVSDFMKMQNDVKALIFDIFGKGVVKTVKGGSALSAIEKKALNMLEDWDGTYKKDSPAALIFESFYLKFIENTFKDEMGEKLYIDFIDFIDVSAV
ncbi:penicillin acylase family protein, partial [Spirochaetota bacterium]